MKTRFIVGVAVAIVLAAAQEAYAFCVWVCDWDCWGWCG